MYRFATSANAQCKFASSIQTTGLFNITLVVALIAPVASSISALVLMSNKRLTEAVKIKTSELKIANESLAQSNKQLQASNTLPSSEANEQLKAHTKMQEGAYQYSRT